jgi:uncharacterized membrane protein
MRRDIAAIKEAICIANTSGVNSPYGAQRNAVWSLRPWVARYRAQLAGQYIILRRKRKMQTKDINIVSLTIAILGALKIVLEAFNVDIITDDQINSIANAVAAVVTIVGVILSHSKPKGATIDDAISNTIERSE